MCKHGARVRVHKRALRFDFRADLRIRQDLWQGLAQQPDPRHAATRDTWHGRARFVISPCPLSPEPIGDCRKRVHDPLNWAGISYKFGTMKREIHTV